MQCTTTGPSRIRDGGERSAEPLAVALQEVDVRPRVVIRDVLDDLQMSVELGNVLAVEGLAEHRDVDDLDVDVARRVLGELLWQAQVDDPLHAVLGQRAPAGVGQRANVVGAHDRSGTRHDVRPRSGSPPRSRTFRQPSQSSVGQVTPRPARRRGRPRSRPGRAALRRACLRRSCDRSRGRGSARRRSSRDPCGARRAARSGRSRHAACG